MQLAKTDVELSEHVIKYTQSSCTGIYNGVLFRFLGMTKKNLDF
jgi:hypothetical protein